MRAPGRRRPHRTDRSDPPASVDLVEVVNQEAGWYKGYPTDCPEWLL